MVRRRVWTGIPQLPAAQVAGDGAAARPLAFAVPRARLRLDGGEFGERADAADVVKAAGAAVSCSARHLEPAPFVRHNLRVGIQRGKIRLRAATILGGASVVRLRPERCALEGPGTEVEAAFDEMGFEWEPSSMDSRNLKRIEELRAFKEKYGNLNVPNNSKEYSGLYDWCVVQKHSKRKGKINPKIEAALNKMGFVWGTRTEPGRVLCNGANAV